MLFCLKLIVCLWYFRGMSFQRVHKHHEDIPRHSLNTSTNDFHRNHSDSAFETAKNQNLTFYSSTALSRVDTLKNCKIGLGSG